MCTVWHVDKYKITFKLVLNSRGISRGSVPGRGSAVEKHCLTTLTTDCRQGVPVRSSCENLLQFGKGEIDLLEICF